MLTATAGERVMPAATVEGGPMSTAAAEQGLVLRVDPALAEAVVGRALARRPPAEAGPVATDRDRRDAAYAIADPAERDAAFGRLALAEFDALGLAEPIRRAIAEWPTLASRIRFAFLGEARGRLDEGVTAEADGPHIGIRLEAARLEDPAGLLAWARHTLGHAEDTLDPAFGFVPGWDEPGAARVAPAAQGRLHHLWDVCVDARLATSGRSAAGSSRARHVARIAADLPGVDGSGATAVVTRLWEGPRPTFGELLAWASRPVDLLEHVLPGQRWMPRPDRCPLCGFPSDDVIAPSAAVATLVAAEYPAWRATDGLCGRCTDRYRLAGRLGGGP